MKSNIFQLIYVVIQISHYSLGQMTREKTYDEPNKAFWKNR